MAILKLGDKSCEVPVGVRIYKIAEEMGLLFGCREGLCEVCKVKIVSGEENLNEITENEFEMGIVKPNRLCCQIILSGGTVEIEPDSGLAKSDSTLVMPDSGLNK